MHEYPSTTVQAEMSYRQAKLREEYRRAAGNVHHTDPASDDGPIPERESRGGWSWRWAVHLARRTQPS